MRLSKMMKRAQSGFTLIELMIVVAIIGILAAVAMPAYQNYTLKAKFSEIVSAVGSYKTSVELCNSDTGTVAGCDAGSNGVPAAITSGAGTYIATIAVDDGVITATANTAGGLNSQTYVLTPSLSGGALVWTASGGCKTAPALC